MPSENLVFSKFNYSFPYEENLALRQWFSEQISRGLLESSSLSWTSVRQGESVYLYQAYHFDGVYLVAWASGDGLFSGIKANTLSAQGEIVYLQPGEVRAVKDVAEDFCLELSPEYTDIRIVVTDQPYLEWGRFSVMIGFVVFILLVVLGVSVYTLQYYRRYVQTPLDHFVRHVGEDAAQRQTVKRGGIQELNDAVEAFDDLSRQIKKLRIDLYEEKLALAQTEMEYYQLQIKPHFFVNCFSLIHAMAQKQEYQRIQEFCVKLSNLCALPVFSKPEPGPTGTGAVHGAGIFGHPADPPPGKRPAEGGNRRLHPGAGDPAAVPAHLCGERGETWGIQKRRH